MPFWKSIAVTPQTHAAIALLAAVQGIPLYKVVDTLARKAVQMMPPLKDHVAALTNGDPT